MKTLSPLLSLIVGLAALGGGPLTVTAAPAAPAEVKPPRSVFIIPVNPKEGRDPFFPNSQRIYQTATVSRSAAPGALSIKSFSVSEGRRMVIINNHTFAAGDVGDVITAEGRVRVHCLEIKSNSVVVDADGQRQELIYQSN